MVRHTNSRFILILILVWTISCGTKDNSDGAYPDIIPVTTERVDSLSVAQQLYHGELFDVTEGYNPELEYSTADFIPRKISFIVIHCTATGPRFSFTVESLLYHFKNNRKWSRPGYHRFLDKDATWHKLHDFGCDEFMDYNEMAWGVRGSNHMCIHIAWDGGHGGVDDRDDDMREVLHREVKALHRKYPDAQIVGHRHFSPDLNGDGVITSNEWIKKCPSFDVAAEFEYLNNPDADI